MGRKKVNQVSTSGNIKRAGGGDEPVTVWRGRVMDDM